MNEKTDFENFSVMVKKGKIDQPTHKSFSRYEWDNQFFKYLNYLKENNINVYNQTSTIDDINTYSAGTIIDNLLSEIREESKKNNKQFKNLDDALLLKLFISYSNREMSMLKNKQKNEGHSITTDKMKSFNGNDLTASQISHGAIDGLQIAIKLRVNAKVQNELEHELLDDKAYLKFIQKESILSQMYSTYESLWQAVLWSKYRITKIKKDDNIYVITQQKRKEDVNLRRSQDRIERTNIQERSIYAVKIDRQTYSNVMTIKPIKVDNGFTIYTTNLKKITNIHSINYHSWKKEVETLNNNFPSEWLSDNHKYNFSINDALEVMKHLSIFSFQLLEMLPKNPEVWTIKKLIKFCPIIDKKSLVDKLSIVTETSTKKTQEILDFLTASNSSKDDLWCHPIIKIDDESYAPLIAALHAPVIARLVEHWLVKRDVKLDKKGTQFEKNIIRDLEDKIQSHPMNSIISKPVGKEFKLKSQKEEIDLILKIGNTILIGECKSIITTDSEISSARTKETLEYASRQVLRKRDFILNNKKDFLKKIGWETKEIDSIEILPCVINSNMIFSGHTLNGVPVIDQKIISHYFSACTTPIISRKTKNNKIEHLAFYELYNDETTFEKNLKTYLNHPPQLVDDENSFEYTTQCMPFIKDSSNKIIYKFIQQKEKNNKLLEEKKHHFPLILSENYDDFMSSDSIFV
ncbi:hypothetical protein [Thalassospira lucentensis]|uniref:hypothetical protein n=1 Tax=Thalassospira lucentensis TaxID=168935 RepID=UPI003AA9A8E6